MAVTSRSTSIAAAVAFPTAERNVRTDSGGSALPLLGERAGVRVVQPFRFRFPSSIRSRAFTLIELLLVMALLLIVLAVSFPSLRGFFRGRHLDHEARRFLSLTRYAQSRAVSEGYPMVLWIDAKQGVYGMQAQTGYLDEDDKSVEYEIHETLELEVIRPLLVRVTATQRNESASVAGNLPSIRFTPDGFYTDSSLERVVIRQGSEDRDRDEDEVVIAKSENRLGYEIQTSSEQIARR
jgi:type II secretion system protein H